MLTSGTLLQDRYRIDRLMELGSMGGMYRAWDVQREVPVSVKELIPQPDLEADVLGQLHRQVTQEAQALMGLKHPAMALGVDFFQFEGADVGRENAYLVTDFVEGENLADCVARVGALPEEHVLAWAGQILDVLAYCHDNGVLHRDIKPQNIILKPDGNVVLVGFELAKLWDSNDPRTWTATRVMGTPEYAPPERWGLQTWHIDARSDLYSFGATLYYALTGQVPLTAGERTANPYRFLPVRELRPRVSARTKSAVVRAMALPRGKRFQSAAAMQAALMDKTPLRVSEDVHPAALMLPSRGERLRNWLLLVLIGVMALSVAGVVGVVGRAIFDGALLETSVTEAGAPPVIATQAVVVPTTVPTLAPTIVPVETPLPTNTVVAASPVAWTPVFSDAFDDNANDWVVGGYEDDWGTVTRVITDGLYTWNVTAFQSVGRWCLPEIEPTADFYLAVDAQRVSGPVDASYGMVFRHSEGSYYLFSIRDDGFFNFNLWYGFEWSAIIDWTGTLAIRPGEVNRLAVQAEGTQFTFFINDEVVAQAESAQLSEGEAGLSVLLVTPGDAVFVFDDFAILVP